ncbi:ABC-2 type transport system ATP-binding protein [Prauserella marina]|uniref:ABC-2 type transport system ATP-binding protein n=1 Tax=Prauserella marina TaxID=530584 RepID=A0A1G6SRQ2_9PSEU|nr:ABC-2 type transport system ATP-binding protein [Prauserella marina]SDD19499.1 ABC-2 type transport system ATP-binding protein [Prauserella marina]
MRRGDDSGTIDAVIEATQLSKRYGNTLAVDDLSFRVSSGRVTGFLGPNGAGKSTTMRMILGLDNPTSGSVHIDGKHYRELRNPLRTVGALLEAGWVHPNRSARNHLRWIARSNELPRKRVDEVLNLVGLSSVASKRAGGFSLGMLQRLGIASALLGDPEVLLFDEPVNGLDPEGIHWIRELMHTLAEEGRTVFVSSHLLSEMAQTAQDLVVIGRGKLIYQGTTDDFVSNATAQSVRIRTPQLGELKTVLDRRELTFTEADGSVTVFGSEAAALGDLAFGEGITLHELSPQRGSLEQAFMQITGEAVEFHAEERPAD